MNNKTFSMIGLACKAGKVVSGEDAIRNNLKNGKIKLLIIAEDASENTIKRFTNAAEFYHIDCNFLGTKEMLGKYTGKQNRAAIGILDDGFKMSIINIIKQENGT